MNSPRLFAAVPLIFLLAACGGDAGTEGETAPAGGAPVEIAQRQDNFEAISDSFKVIRTQLEGSSPDFAAIEAAAVDINERATLVGGYFPAGSGVDAGYDTEALASIWEKPAEFEAATQKLIDESATMVTLAQGGDAAAVGAHVRELGGSCKNCHDSFRLDDE